MKEAGLVAVAAGEGPLADGADVYVDELADGIVADAAIVEAEGYVAELAGGDAGDADVDCFGLHVLRVLGHAGDCRRGRTAAGAEEVVRPGSAVAADYVDDAAVLAELGHQGVQEIELLGVVVALVLGAVIAEEVVELVHRGGDVSVADAVDDIEALAGVQVVELELVLLAGWGDGGGGGRSGGFASAAVGQQQADGRDGGHSEGGGKAIALQRQGPSYRGKAQDQGVGLQRSDLTCW